MLSKTFNLLFYLKKPKNYVNGKMPIYLADHAKKKFR